MTVCPLFRLCVYNESSLIGHTDVVNSRGTLTIKSTSGKEPLGEPGGEGEVGMLDG